MISEKELLNRIEENKFKFLGLIEISEEEYGELLAYSRIFVRNVSPSNGVKCDIRIAVALVQIAIRDYKEGKYWAYFCDAIDENVSQAKMNYCGQVFAKTVKQFGLMYIDYGNNQMYVENIKMHAVVTNYYMQGLWDFLFSYYERNLFRQLPDDIEEDLSFLSLFMKQTLENNSDSFVNEDLKGKAAKSYRLLKATRYLIANNCPQDNTEILLPLLKIIDNYFYDDELPDVHNRFGKAFIVWCNEKEGEKTRECISNRSLVSRRPNIFFDFNNLLPYLHIPPQKFREAEFDGEAHAQVIINGYSETISLEMYKSFGVYISEPKNIPIPSLFDEIEIVIESTVTKKYKVKKSNYRLLSKSLGVVSKLSLGENLIFTEKGTKVTFEGDTRYIDYSSEYFNFDYYSIAVSEDSVIHFGNRVISMAGEYSEQPYFEDEVLDFEIFDADNNRLIVTRTHPVVSFAVEEKKYAGTFIFINERRILISDIKNKVMSRAANLSDLAITIDLENEIGTVDGVYSVVIDIPDEKDKRIPKYVRLSSLEVFCDKCLYSDNDSVYVWIKNGKSLVWPEREDVDIVDIRATSEEYLVPIYGDEEEIIFNLELNEILKIRLPLFLFKAGFSIDEMTYKQPEYIWYSELRETLYCKAPNVEEIRIYLNHRKDLYIQGDKIKEGVFRIDISELKQHIVNNSNEGWQYINVVSIGERKRSFCLYSIMRVLWVEPYFDLKLIENQIAFDLSIKGNADLYVDIQDESTKEMIISGKRIINGINIIPELSQEGQYSIFPKMEERDFFGINTTLTKLRPLFKQSFVSFDDLRNYRLTIGDLIFEDEKKILSYEYLIDLREKVGDGIYSGYMHGLKKAVKQNGTSGHSGKYELNADHKPIKKKFGKVRVHILESDEKAFNIQILISSYDEVEEEWLELFYDNISKTLLHPNDNAVSKGTEYSRFDFLDVECTRYRIMKKKIRRLRADVV